METGSLIVRAALVLVIALAGCRSPQQAPAKPIGAVVHIESPLGLPPVPVPSGNQPTVEAIALGRRLFYDRRLSVDDTLSCASCHNPQLGFSDGSRHSTGFRGQIGTRNAPTIVNAAFAPLQFWDGRAASLEEQAAGPIANPVEMNQQHDVCLNKLSAIPSYRDQFRTAFGSETITLERVEMALASFERTIISGNSPFDRYRYGGDPNALSPSAIRGLAVFSDKQKGNCIACHTIEPKYALFTDGKFHNIGIGVSGEGEITDVGRYGRTQAEIDRGAFKTPTLRNIALSAPYMHDGSLKTLKDVVEFYVGGGNSNPGLDKEIKPLNLTNEERTDLIAFLQALTGEMPPNVGPPTK